MLIKPPSMHWCHRVRAAHNTGNPVQSALISQEMDIPHNFLSKILNRLSQAGLIKAVRGRGGGVRLSRPASEILVFDVVSLFMIVDATDNACWAYTPVMESVDFICAGELFLNNLKKYSTTQPLTR